MARIRDGARALWRVRNSASSLDEIVVRGSWCWESRGSEVPGKDIVGHGGNVKLVAQSQAQCAHEGGFARANGSSGVVSMPVWDRLNGP